MCAYSKYIMGHTEIESDTNTESERWSKYGNGGGVGFEVGGWPVFVKHQTFVMNNIYDLDAPIIQIHGLFMIILSNI